ncbi:MAG: ECF-type sigma factor, partial [Chloroflexia bacterium]
MICGLLAGKGMGQEIKAAGSQSPSPSGQELERENLRELLATVYPELRRIACRKLSGERRHHTLQPTALTNEVVLRLLRREIEGEDPQVLLWAGIVEMRRILIDYGRRWQMQRNYAESVAARGDGAQEAIDQAVHLELLLDQLEQLDPRAREVVELRFYLGLSVKETAELLGLCMRTVNEDWEFARGWLAQRWRTSL